MYWQNLTGLCQHVCCASISHTVFLPLCAVSCAAMLLKYLSMQSRLREISWWWAYSLLYIKLSVCPLCISNVSLGKVQYHSFIVGVIWRQDCFVMFKLCSVCCGWISRDSLKCCKFLDMYFCLVHGPYIVRWLVNMCTFKFKMPLRLYVQIMLAYRRFFTSRSDVLSG